MRQHIKPLSLLLLVTLMLPVSALSGPVDLPNNPARKTLVPYAACFVAKYPEWVATVLYKDGHAHHFDGAKDLFKYLLDMPTWAPGHRAEDIDSIGVTEYYGLSPHRCP